MVAATGTSIGHKALIVAAKTLAATAIDLYTDPAKLAAVKDSWQQARGDTPWQTLLPSDQAAPTRIR